MAEVLDDSSFLMESDKLNVLLVGNGGRESALAWKLSQSERLGRLYTTRDDVAYRSSRDIIRFATDPDIRVDLAVIGLDQALADGLVDEFKAVGIPAFGPSRLAAQIESSKAYGKRLMDETGVPTANYRVFSNPGAAYEYINEQSGPFYIKASGLAEGKAALECLTYLDAKHVINQLMEKKLHGAAGSEIIIEELIIGQEMSLHALCDGENYLMFPSSQDHKRRDEGDTGPNTGGMGTIAPVPWFNQADVEDAAKLTVEPILSALNRQGRPFQGILYPGLILNGDLRVLEYNARFGDPEAQVYMRLLKSDLLEVITACLSHRLDKTQLEWSDDYAVCIVAASENYPGDFLIQVPINGIDQAQAMDGVEVFPAGLVSRDGNYFASAGRVLGVTAVAPSLSGAINLGYEAIDKIKFAGKMVRRDIGYKALYLTG